MQTIPEASEIAVENDAVDFIPDIKNTISQDGEIDFSDIEFDGYGDQDIEGKKMIRMFYKEHGLLKFERDAYDHWVKVDINKQVQRMIPYPPQKNNVESVYYVEFTGARVSGRPTVQRIDKANNTDRLEDVTPLVARLEGITYCGHLLVSGRIVEIDTNNIISEFADVKCGNIPIMVGSSLCHLYDQEKGRLKPRYILMRDYGEDELDPFTYFIIGGTGKGNERYIVRQEKLASNVALTYINNKTNDTVVKMNCNTERLSSREVYCIYDSRGIFTIKTYFLAEYKNSVKSGKMLGISFVSIIRIILNKPDMPWDDVIRIYVEPMIPNNLKNLAKTKLTKTYQRYANMDPYEEAKDIWKKDWQSYTDQEAEELIYDHVVTDVFPQIEEDIDIIKFGLDGTEILSTAERRCHTLGLLVSRMILFTLGKASYDDRDNWGNKRLEGPAFMLKHLFVQIWAKFCATLGQKLTSPDLSQDKITKMINDVAKTEISARLESNFRGMWGVSNTCKRNGVTEVLERENNIMAPLVQLMKTSPPTRSEGKIVNARKIKSSQIGFIGLAETSEGNNCGLVKKLALTALVTKQPSRDDMRNVNELCLKYCVHPSKYQRGMSTVILDGKFFGYTSPENIQSMREDRRNGEIPYDTEIYLDKYNILNITVVECRLIRPLLVVENRQLVLDKLIEQNYDVWSLSMRELRQLGAIEYLDAKEIQSNHVLIARRIEDVRNMKSKYKELYEETNKLLGGMVKEPLDNYRDMRDFVPSLMKKMNDITADKRQDIMKILTKIWRNYDANYNYSHCEIIRGNTMFSIASSLIPFIGHNAAARVSFQSQMSIQAIGTRNPRWIVGNTRTLVHSQKPLIYTDMSKVLGADDNPSGTNVIVAFMSLGGYNQEDAIVINEAYKEMFMSINYKMYETTKKSDEQIGTRKSIVEKNPRKYAALRPDGLPQIGAYVEDSQAIIGKYVRGANKNHIDRSVVLKLGDYGVVDDVQHVTKGEQEIVRVIIKKIKVPEIGDKFASRYAQKSTVSHYEKNENMPYVVVPPKIWETTYNEELSEYDLMYANGDEYEKILRRIKNENKQWLKEGTNFKKNDCLIFNMNVNDDTSVYASENGFVKSVSLNGNNITMLVQYKTGDRSFPIGLVVSPNAIPTRMTPSKMLEAYIGFTSTITGTRYSADPFREVNIDNFKEVLTQNGYNGYGYHEVYDGITGKKLKADIFIGVVNYQTLKHQVLDKFQARGAVGKVDIRTSQPTGGRAAGKSVRSGHMTGNAAFSGSNPYVMQEICERSDMTTVIVCENCTLIGDPIKGSCGMCDGKMVKCRIRSSLIHNINLLRAAGIDPRLQLGDKLDVN